MTRKRNAPAQPDLLGGDIIEGSATVVETGPANAPKKPVELPSTDLVISQPGSGAIVLVDMARVDAFTAKVRAELDSDGFVPDVTTDKGRKAIAARAFRVTKAKTALDADAKKLTENWRRQTAIVNEARKRITDNLTEIAQEARRPLTEWEAAEAERVAKNQETMAEIRDAAMVGPAETSEEVANRGRRIYLMKFEPPQWSEEEAEQAEIAKGATVKALMAAVASIKQAEAERAELEKLRREKEERERLEQRQESAKRALSEWLDVLIGEAQLDPDFESYRQRLAQEAARFELSDMIDYIMAEGVKVWPARRAGELAAREQERLSELMRQREEERQRQMSVARGCIASIVEALSINPERPVEIPSGYVTSALREAQLDPAEWLDVIRTEAGPVWHNRRAALVAAEEAAAERTRREMEQAAAERQREADQRTAEAEAEAQRLRDMEAQRQREIEQQAEAERQRAADQEHRRAVMEKAELAIVQCGVGRAAANRIVLEIIAGNVPGVALAF